ncbi:MAG TPA: universal stress protein [Phycisphaerae bacterium]|nr:universal stress protein [Phycisphaerae bacterium]
MLVTHSERPRELKWYHAGPMLYGDWGTSRFYVLGLALFYALHASFYYVLAVGILVAAVGWAYTIICRCYPDGGGVYSAARHTSQQLAVVGALLLFADYIVTAALSAYDGIRYMGLPKSYVPYVAMLAICVVGVINYIGPKKAGTVALVIAVATLFLTFILTIFSVPHLAAGWHAIHAPEVPLRNQWTNFVAVVLALSGVEAIANMTGIMVPPVTKTANKAIWPVLVEVVVLNLILGIAMNGLPKAGYDLGPAPANAYEEVENIQQKYTDWRTNPKAQEEIQQQATLAHVAPEVLLNRSADLKDRQDHYTDAVLRVMAEVYVDPHGMTLHIGSYRIGLFSLACGFVFGFLLLSAVNTAVADMISIQYVMSRDTELPHVLTRLNKFGVPYLALVAAIGLPVVILNIFQDLNTLANLYAVGVVGAIAINLGSCSINHEMPIKKWERACLACLAVIMVAIEGTLVYEKPDARYFALFVLCAGLAARFFTKSYPKYSAAERGYALVAWGVGLFGAATVCLYFEPSIAAVLHDTVALLKYGETAKYATYLVGYILLTFGGTSLTYAARYLSGKMPMPVPAALTPGLPPTPAAALATATGTAPGELHLERAHVLVATRGGKKLLEFAAKYCNKTNGIMFVLFVRQVNIVMGGPASAPRVEEDAEALKAFALAAEICQKQNVQMLPMYAVSSDVPYTILDFAATYNAEAVLMGVSREGAILRALRGDVITAVADNLPEDISLLIHA